MNPGRRHDLHAVDVLAPVGGLQIFVMASVGMAHTPLYCGEWYVVLRYRVCNKLHSCAKAVEGAGAVALSSVPGKSTFKGPNKSQE